jgi:hypothetical protein
MLPVPILKTQKVTVISFIILFYYIYMTKKTPTPEQMEKLEAQIKDTYYKAWTDLIEKELNEDKFDYVCKLHSEIVVRICSAIPNRGDIHDIIAENMDPVLFKQQLENKAFTGPDFLNLVQYVYTWIKRLSSRGRDQSIEDSLNEIMKNVNEGKTMGQLVPIFLIKVHSHLDDLDQDLGRETTVQFKEFANKHLKKETTT